MDTIQGKWVLENNDTRLKISFGDGTSGFSMNIYSIGPKEVEFAISPISATFPTELTDIRL